MVGTYMYNFVINGFWGAILNFSPKIRLLVDGYGLLMYKKNTNNVKHPKVAYMRYFHGNDIMLFYIIKNW